jgi:Tol biopolymer transport system component
MLSILLATAALATPATLDRWPVWSPNRAEMAFIRRIGRNSSFEVARSDGSALAAARADDGHPAWSHDGRYVAFDRTRELGAGYTNTSIETVRSDGRRLRHITPTSVSVDAVRPVWSPDDGWLAFEVASRYLPTTVQWERRNGRSANALSVGGDSSDTASVPSWSPDSRRLAMAARVGSRSGLYVVQRSTGRAARVAVGQVRFSTWSPDGRRIAFADSISVALVAPAGGAVTRLAAPASRISWSPDGTRLAYAAGCAVGIVAADATGPPPELTPCPPEVETSTPSWSPDGRRIAYSICRRPVCSMFIAAATPNAAGGVQIIRARDPAWSPSGREIAYTRVAGSAPTRIYLVRPDGTHAHPLLR